MFEAAVALVAKLSPSRYRSRSDCIAATGLGRVPFSLHAVVFNLLEKLAFAPSIRLSSQEASNR
jgi:hypothetical protein